MLSFRPGRSSSALATLAITSWLAVGDDARCRARNSTVLRSLPPPPPSSENGAVTDLGRTGCTMTFQISAPMLNCGSLIEPVSGRSRSITPWRSCSSATARRTGSLVASGLSVFVAEGQLVDDDLVARVELAVGVDLVGHVDAELAALDRVAGVLGRIRRQARQLDVGGLGRDVQCRRHHRRVDRRRRSPAGRCRRRGP